MRIRQLLVAICLLGALALSGCQMPGIPGFSMPDDGPPIAVSEEAAAALEQKVVAAAATPGVTTVTVTQEEVTSYLALRLNDAAVQNNVANPLQEPQVYFRDDGSIVLRANVLFQERTQPIRVVARPTAVDGSLQVDITEGRIGPVPVPGALLDQVEGQLGQAILAGQDYARLDEIRVGAGSLTLTGERRQ